MSAVIQPAGRSAVCPPLINVNVAHCGRMLHSGTVLELKSITGFNEYVFIPICVVKHQKNEVLMWSQAPCTCPLPPARLTEPLLTSLPLWIFMLCLLARWYFHYGPTTVLIQNAHWSLLCSQVSLFSRFSFFFFGVKLQKCAKASTLVLSFNFCTCILQTITQDIRCRAIFKIWM